MSNHNLSHGKTLFDVFNMINPNCYQAFIIQCIIENKKSEAVQYCNELLTAFDYYKWDSSGKQSDYVDRLICESNLYKWQKLAIIQIISNNVIQCKNILEDEISSEASEFEKRKQIAMKDDHGLEDLYRVLGFGRLI